MKARDHITNGTAQGTARDFADVEDFVRTLGALKNHPSPALRDLFAPGEDIYLTRAPGRLDLMGGIADYSGSLVLQLPIAEATLVALQKEEQKTGDHPAPALRVVSLAPEGDVFHFEMPLADLTELGRAADRERARAYFARDPARAWAAYVAGAFLVLMRERECVFGRGARLLISSRVPAGKGVSSSAALEVAVMSAVVAAYDVPIETRELALLCQRVENAVVGAPCGVMDQMTSACGEAHRLLALRCQPAEIEGTIPLPPDLAVWGIDSGVRHSIGAGDYGSVRVGAFMGYRMIAEMAELKVDQANSRVEIEDPVWGGYLANITPSEFEERWAARVPGRMGGREFIARYGGTTDAATVIDAEKIYAVRAPTAHPIYENFRVRAFAELLGGGGERSGKLLGELMYQSHASYSACGLGSAGTDRLVELVREGAGRELYGAKITGGGSGGTVAVLGKRGADAAVRRIAERYEAETGRRPYIFTGSSAGSGVFGHLMLSVGS